MENTQQNIGKEKTLNPPINILHVHVHKIYRRYYMHNYTVCISFFIFLVPLFGVHYCSCLLITRPTPPSWIKGLIQLTLTLETSIPLRARNY